jgi:hypothetical protein
MRLHALLIAGSFVALVASGTARANENVERIVNTQKDLECAPGATATRPSKVRSLFQTQAQLFVEQKEAPAASKTALRLDGAARFSTKSKD